MAPPEQDTTMSDDGIDHDEEDNDGGLFGSGSEDDGNEQQPQLDDEDLLTDDEKPSRERGGPSDDAEDDDDENREPPTTVLDATLGVHPTPKGSDGEIYTLKFPPFLGIDPVAYTARRGVPASEHHMPAGAPPSATFSAHNVAKNTLRWRRSQRDPDRLVSNARIIRWSDGSLTLQSGANPTEQYELNATAFAQPQRAPRKPTPTSKPAGPGSQHHQPYDPNFDSHTYVASTHERAMLLFNTSHVTTALTVDASSTANDDALAKLQASMRQATRTQADGGLSIISVTEDPELAKRKAEIAEREQMKAQKKLAQNAAREAERTNRALSKHGLGRTSGGLGGNDLEGDGGPSRRRGPGATPSKRRAARKGMDSDTDDDMPRGRTKEDEYDKTDDFLVDSDEEEEVEGEGEEEEEVEVEEQPRKAKRKESPVGEAAEAEGGARSRRRRIVADDDEDDE